MAPLEKPAKWTVKCATSTVSKTLFYQKIFPLSIWLTCSPALIIQIIFKMDLEHSPLYICKSGWSEKWFFPSCLVCCQHTLPTQAPFLLEHCHRMFLEQFLSNVSFPVQHLPNEKSSFDYLKSFLLIEVLLRFDQQQGDDWNKILFEDQFGDGWHK